MGRMKSLLIEMMEADLDFREAIEIAEWKRAESGDVEPDYPTPGYPNLNPTGENFHTGFALDEAGEPFDDFGRRAA